MKRLSFLTLVPFFAACAGEKGFELPTIAVGSGGARFLNDDSTPHQAYNKSYASVVKKQREIDETGKSGVAVNHSFVDRALESILKDLKVMQGLLATPEPEKMNSLIEFYTGMHKLAHTGQLNLGNAVKKKLHNRGRDVQRQFSPLEVTLKAAEEKVVENKSEITENTTPEKISIPVPIEKEGEEKIIRSTGPTPDREPKKEPKPTSNVEFRLLYKAWRGAHAELVEAFRKRNSTVSAYEEVTTALKKISGMLTPKEANSLLVYRRFYTKIYDDTNGFTKTPEGAKDEDILNDLRIVSSGIQKEIDPAKRK